MKDNRLLKVLWGIVLAIFLCSALFIGISYFTGGDNSSSKKKDNETTSSKDKNTDKDKSKDKDSLNSKTKEKSDEEKYREAKDSNNGNNSSSTNSSKSESNKSNNSNKAVSNVQNNATNNRSNNDNAANNSNKEDKKEVTEANGGATSPGTFSNTEAAHSYAKEEINRLAKENKKNYSYTLERNNKNEVVVKITQG